MRAVGFVATTVVVLAIIAALGVFVLSLPDLARYRRLRRM